MTTLPIFFFSYSTKFFEGTVFFFEREIVLSFAAVEEDFFLPEYTYLPSTIYIFYQRRSTCTKMCLRRSIINQKLKKKEKALFTGTRFDVDAVTG